jgi:hypothetical protein
MNPTECCLLNSVLGHCSLEMGFSYGMAWGPPGDCKWPHETWSLRLSTKKYCAWPRHWLNLTEMPASESTWKSASYSSRGVVSGIHRITRTDYRPEDSGGSIALTDAKRQTQAKKLPQIVYILHLVHCWIFQHCQAAHPNQWREADSPVVCRGR